MTIPDIANMSEERKKNMLVLGAGNYPVPGATNHDLHIHRPEITVAHDLNDVPWPWEDNSFNEILAWAVLEHLRINLLESMAECWRILRPDGVLRVKLPLWDKEESWSDPTHYWKFSLACFDQFDPATRRGKQYAFYTPYKWKIIRPAVHIPKSASLHAVLQVRKP